MSILAITKQIQDFEAEHEAFMVVLQQHLTETAAVLEAMQRLATSEVQAVSQVRTTWESHQQQLANEIGRHLMSLSGMVGQFAHQRAVERKLALGVLSTPRVGNGRHQQAKDGGGK